MSKRNPPKSVVDTNLIVSGLLLKRGLPYELLEAWRAGSFQLLVSEPLREEYKQVLSRPKFAHKYGLTSEEVAVFLNLVSLLARQAIPRRRLPVKVRDPKDEKVLAAALGGKADYLVTGDDDLLVLRDDPRLKQIKIVTAAEFLEVLADETAEK
ncbi:MAG: putative toxin-antitoxin system toxin component, PIN family [Chloroflexota bacterium]|nr:MAG: putative toxin-antitoxin system toxin component, PIN family [Chloroflexota bacterium]